jgi:hypothetical protein
MTDTKPQLQKSQTTPNKKNNQKKYISRQSCSNFRKIKDKEKRSFGGRKPLAYGGARLRITSDFISFSVCI